MTTNLTPAAIQCRPDLSTPLMRGLISGIYAMHANTRWEATRRSGGWEILRSLWQNGAMTFEAFRWLESLSTALVNASAEAPHGCIAIPWMVGWDTLLEAADAIDRLKVLREQIRERRGLQAAADETRDLSAAEVAALLAADC